MFGHGSFGTVPFGATSVPIETQPIDSSRWTGLPTDSELTEVRLGRLRVYIERARRDLDTLGATNAEKAQAQAFIIAMAALADAPDPQADLIWKILERGMALVGACDIFYQIAEAVFA